MVFSPSWAWNLVSQNLLWNVPINSRNFVCMLLVWFFYLSFFDDSIFIKANFLKKWSFWLLWSFCSLTSPILPSIPISFYWRNWDNLIKFTVSVSFYCCFLRILLVNIISVRDIVIWILLGILTYFRNWFLFDQCGYESNWTFTPFDVIQLTICRWNWRSPWRFLQRNFLVFW